MTVPLLPLIGIAAAGLAAGAAEAIAVVRIERDLRLPHLDPIGVLVSLYELFNRDIDRLTKTLRELREPETSGVTDCLVDVYCNQFPHTFAYLGEYLPPDMLPRRQVLSKIGHNLLSRTALVQFDN